MANANSANIKAAAIHMRFGDFKKTSWGVLPSDWYRAALLQLSQSGIKEVDCFSDDLNDAKQITQGLNHLIRFRFPEERTPLLPHELLYIMSKYRYFVSSNSTLSWWSCYFNSRHDQIIISPWKDELHLDDWRKVD